MGVDVHYGHLYPLNTFFDILSFTINNKKLPFLHIFYEKKINRSLLFYIG